jgi:predicted benzoate:H+ symporter BenE
LQGGIRFDALTLTLAKPEFVFPTFNWGALLSVGVPLFIVTMTSQNFPAIAILKANNYKAPLSSAISWTCVASLILAPFGTIANGLVTALSVDSEREAALITFLVTASGIVLGGVGSAFWGLIVGLLVRWVYGFRK